MHSTLYDGTVTAIRSCSLASGSLANGMAKISYKGYRFPPEIIQKAIWLYLRFTRAFALVQAKRNKRAALKLMRKLLKKYGFLPEALVTDDLRSYRAAARDLGIAHRHCTGRWRNNRAENSHQPTRRRERKMHVRRLAPLAFLSPKIVQPIADGAAPAGLTVSRLTESLPHSWAAQEQMLGLG